MPRRTNNVPTATRRSPRKKTDTKEKTDTKAIQVRRSKRKPKNVIDQRSDGNSDTLYIYIYIYIVSVLFQTSTTDFYLL